MSDCGTAWTNYPRDDPSLAQQLNAMAVHGLPRAAPNNVVVGNVWPIARQPPVLVPLALGAAPMLREVTRLRAENETLRAAIATLRTELAALKPPEPPPNTWIRRLGRTGDYGLRTAL